MITHSPEINGRSSSLFPCVSVASKYKICPVHSNSSQRHLMAQEQCPMKESRRARRQAHLGVEQAPGPVGVGWRCLSLNLSRDLKKSGTQRGGRTVSRPLFTASSCGYSAVEGLVALSWCWRIRPTGSITAAAAPSVSKATGEVPPPSPVSRGGPGAPPGGRMEKVGADGPRRHLCN